MAVALNAFLLNNNLVIGIGGISRIIEKLSGISQNYVYWVLSTLILLLGSLLNREKHKSEFIFRSFAGIMWVSLVFLPLTRKLTAFRLPLPEPIGFLFLPVTSSIGAFLMGLGIGITIKAGGSTCGLDLIAQVFEKEKSIEKSFTMRILDSIILIIGAMAFQVELMYIGSGLILIYLLPKAVEFADRRTNR